MASAGRVRRARATRSTLAPAVRAPARTVRPAPARGPVPAARARTTRRTLSSPADPPREFSRGRCVSAVDTQRPGFGGNEMRLIKGLIAAALAASLLVLPGGALAKRHDRDHDRMADKWDPPHHLNTHANDAPRDPDKDGLRNLSEFRHHTDPQKADTDDDGVKDDDELRDDTDPRRDDSDDDGVDDADEISGSIVSFANGVLTIQLPGDGAGTVVGSVNDATVVECDDDDDADRTATTSHDGSDDDNSGPGSGDDDREGDDNSGPGSTSSGPGDGDDDRDDDDDDDDRRCTSADLKPGARVHEAKLVKAT